MSWLARSIVDSLRIDDNGGDEGREEEENVDSSNPGPPQSEVRSNEDDEVVEEDDRIGRGVKEDFTELRESLTRQLLGVASFLAPPPPPPPPPPSFGSNRTWRGEADLRDSGYDSSEESLESAGVLENHCRDELVGALQSNVSTDEADSNYYYFEEDHLDDVVGVTEEVLAFAINIAHHPETWLDFPLEEEDDNDDFDLSDAQYKHVLAIQHYAPRLTALKIELCPAHMSESYFWMVYFVLLNSRLSRQDAEALSTAQLVTARTMWMQELQKRTKQETDRFGSGSSHREGSNAKSSWNASVDHSTDEEENELQGNRLPHISGFDPHATDFGTENRRIVDSELQLIDKAVIEEEDLAVGPSFKFPILQKYEEEEEEDDDWINDNPELDGYTRTTVNEEDISFSDLEDNDDCFIPVKSKVVIK